MHEHEVQLVLSVAAFSILSVVAAAWSSTVSSVALSVVNVIVCALAWWYALASLEIRRRHDAVHTHVRRVLGIDRDPAVEFASVDVSDAWNSHARIATRPRRSFVVAGVRDEKWAAPESCFYKCTPAGMSFADWFSTMLRAGVRDHEREASVLFSEAHRLKATDAAIVPELYYSEASYWCGWRMIVMERVATDRRYSLVDLGGACTTVTATTVPNDSESLRALTTPPSPAPPPIVDVVPDMLRTLARTHACYLAARPDDFKTCFVALVGRTPTEFFSAPSWLIAGVYVLHHLQHASGTRFAKLSACQDVYRASRLVFQSTIARDRGGLSANAATTAVGARLTTLIHGDPHCDNFLLACDKTVRLIDWQASRTESPFFDMAYVLLTSTHGADRVARRDEWLRCYGRALQDAIASQDPTLRRMSDSATAVATAAASESNADGKSMASVPEAVALVQQLTLDDLREHYYHQVARIIVLHIIPFSYSEGTCDASEKRMDASMLTKRRIFHEVVMNGAEELRAAGRHLDVVDWVTRARDLTFLPSPSAQMCDTKSEVVVKSSGVAGSVWNGAGVDAADQNAVVRQIERHIERCRRGGVLEISTTTRVLRPDDRVAPTASLPIASPPAV